MGNYVRDLLLLYNTKRDLIFNRLHEIFNTPERLFLQYNHIWNKLLSYIDLGKDKGQLVIIPENLHSVDYSVSVFRVFSDSFYTNGIELDLWADIVNSKFATLVSLSDTLAAILYYMTSVSIDENDIKQLRLKLL